jgi:hypothetical protein
MLASSFISFRTPLAIEALAIIFIFFASIVFIFFNFQFFVFVFSQLLLAFIAQSFAAFHTILFDDHIIAVFANTLLAIFSYLIFLIIQVLMLFIFIFIPPLFWPSTPINVLFSRLLPIYSLQPSLLTLIEPFFVTIFFWNLLTFILLFSIDF